MNNPVIEGMETMERFQKRLPYYLMAIGISWGICVGLIIKFVFGL